MNELPENEHEKENFQDFLKRSTELVEQSQEDDRRTQDYLIDSTLDQELRPRALFMQEVEAAREKNVALEAKRTGLLAGFEAFEEMQKTGLRNRGDARTKMQLALQRQINILTRKSELIDEQSADDRAEVAGRIARKRMRCAEDDDFLIRQIQLNDKLIEGAMVDITPAADRRIQTNFPDVADEAAVVAEAVETQPADPAAPEQPTAEQPTHG